MPTQHTGELGFNPNAPLVVIEGRAPLPQQQVTRQTYLPAVLREQGVQTLYIEADGPATFAEGLIRSYTVYGGEAHTLEHDSLYAPAWRLRGVARPHCDMQAFLPERGYNAALLRQELATRLSAARALGALGLRGWSVESTPFRSNQWSESGFVFVKPNLVKDVGVNKPGAMARTRLMRFSEVTPAVLAEFSDTPVVQAVEATMNATELLDHLDIATTKELRTDCLHALRIYQPLWAPFDQPPATELRLSNPEDVGQWFATELRLLEPEYVFSSLPALHELHRQVHAALVARYGTLGYPAIDYIIKPDGSVKILSVLARALTPNLEGQRDEVRHLAHATADVEVQKLAELAHESYRQGIRPFVA